MKILAVYFGADFEITIFYKRILLAISKNATLDVVSDQEPDALLDCLNKQYYIPFTTREHGWYRRFLRWFGTAPVSEAWSRRVEAVVAKDYDVILVFVANSQLTPVVCGRYLSQKLGCKFAIYGVDAIPAPGGWTRRRNEFWGKRRIVAKTFATADYLASSNPHMLKYQLSIFPNKPSLYSDVLFTPSPDRYYVAPPSDEMLFLYTGSLYGMRNPDHFFKAFKRLLVKYPNAQFLIVGTTKKLRNLEKILTPEELTHITSAPHTNDLEPLFARAKVLVDIDADLEKDPFLSSKIVTYMKVNRVILSETGKITPSREMFAGLNTVVQCDHNEDSLYEGMLRAIEVADSNPDFSEREDIIKEFSIETVSARFWRGLQTICNQQK